MILEAEGHGEDMSSSFQVLGDCAGFRCIVGCSGRTQLFRMLSDEVHTLSPFNAYVSVTRASSFALMYMLWISGHCHCFHILKVL